MITLFGATGYTGKRIARQLDDLQIPFIIAGRSEEKLRALSKSLRSSPMWIVADALRPDSLPPLYRNTRLLINCVGPFTDLGERIASLAAVTGVHYLDTANELNYVYRLRTLDAIARKNKVAIIPSCAFEVALADCATSVLAGSVVGSISRADIVYHLPGQKLSRGTRLSMLRSLATSWLAFREGRWKGSPPGTQTRQFHFPSGDQAAISIPSCESLTLPAHLTVSDVFTWLTVHPIWALFSPVFLPLYARFLRSLPGRLVLWGAGRESSPEESSHPCTYEIQIQLKGTGQPLSCHIKGDDPYQFTARIISYAAEQMLRPDFHNCGVLAPSQAFPPLPILIAAHEWGVDFSSNLLSL